MLMGIKFQAKPTRLQAQTLSKWMGGAKFVWNAKCDDDKYHRTFARKFLPIGTWAKLDQQYSQYKDPELSPFLSDVPSQILRNSTSNWYASYQQFFKRSEVGRPKKKKKGQGMTIHLTKELFRIENTESGLKLFIGSLRNNIGYLNINWHTKKWLKHDLPKSIRIKKLPSGKFTMSFCYEDHLVVKAEKVERSDWKKHIVKNLEQEDLEKMVCGIDRGVNIAVATDDKFADFSDRSKRGLNYWQKKLKQQQKMLARQKDLKSRRRNKEKLKIAKIHKKISDIRNDQCHKISRELVNQEDTKIYILEDLKTKNMSKSSKGNSEKHGKKVKQKSGLNREILNKGWHKTEVYLKYKANRAGKIVFKINPAYTSQECADCGHTHSQNRSGVDFKCRECGSIHHADINAGKVIKKRAIKLLLDPGTGLSDKGVLRPCKDIGQGAEIRLLKGKPLKAQAKNPKREGFDKKRKTA